LSSGRARPAFFSGRAVGSPDIIGVLPGGRFPAVECKRPDKKPTAAQAAFLHRLPQAGAVALVVGDVATLALALDGLLSGGRCRP
jgi:hypothetical protein